MAEKKREPTERTPKGLEVPIPKRREFFENLKKIAGKAAITTPEWKDAGKESATRRPKE